MIKYVVDSLNKYEYGDILSVELVKENNKLFDYLFREEVIGDILNGDLFEAWNSDGFMDLLIYLDEDVYALDEE